MGKLSTATGSAAADPISVTVIRPSWTPHAEVLRWYGPSSRLPHQLPSNLVITRWNRGCHRILFGGQVYRFASPSMTIARPGEPIARISGESCEVQFDELHLAEALLEDAASSPRIPRVLRVDGYKVEDASLQGLLERTIKAVVEDDRLAGEAALAELAPLLIGCRSGARGESSEPASAALHTVRRARNFVEENFEWPISLADIAAVTGRSRFQLIRAFRATLGITPYAYLTLWRTARARELLRKGMPPAEASVTVGFCDQAHLHRFFRKAYGITPGQYQRPASDADGAR